MTKVVFSMFQAVVVPQISLHCEAQHPHHLVILTGKPVLQQVSAKLHAQQGAGGRLG
jgi:hypothetical protein